MSRDIVNGDARGYGAQLLNYGQAIELVALWVGQPRPLLANTKRSCERDFARWPQISHATGSFATDTVKKSHGHCPSGGLAPPDGSSVNDVVGQGLTRS
jgi:hypothetical protein